MFFLWRRWTRSHRIGKAHGFAVAVFIAMGMGLSHQVFPGLPLLYKGLLGTGLALPLFALYLLCIEKLTDAASLPFLFIYKGSHPDWSREELLEGDLLQVQYLLRQHRIAEALARTDAILRENPGAAKVLFLKARILFDKTRETEISRQCCAKIMASETAPAQYKTLARDLYQRIIKEITP